MLLAPSDHYREVFDALRTRSMGVLAQTAYEILGMPVVFTDAAFVVRAKYPEEPLGDEQWDANTVNCQIEPRYVKTFTDDGHFDRHDMVRKAILTNWGHYKDAPRLTELARARNGIIGYFAALATGIDVQPWHYEIADIVTSAFVLMLEAETGSRQAWGTMSSPTLYALLSGAISVTNDCDMLPIGFLEANRGPYVLFGIRPRNPHNEPLEGYFGASIARQFEQSIQTVVEGMLFVLACGIEGPFHGSDAERGFAEELDRQGLECGASRQFDVLDEVAARKWEACSALRVGTLLKEPGAVHYYDELMSDIVLNMLTSNIPRSALVHPALSAIREYDRANHTEYFKTLKTYREMGLDKKRTCERLHIHRNTLQYRLDRLMEIQPIDIADPSLQLFFAIEDHVGRIHAAEAAQKMKASSFGQAGAL